MRVFVISPVYPDVNNKMLGNFVHEQSLALSELGHEVVVLSVPAMRYSKWFSQDFSTIEYSEMDQIPIFTLPYKAFMTNKFPRIAANNYTSRLIKVYEQAVRSYGVPDIIHAHFTFTSGYSSSIISKEKGVPFIVTEHHSLFLKKNLSKYYTTILKETIDKSKEFITVSNHLKKSIVSITGTNKSIVVIPNIINSNYKYYPVSSERPFVFFSAGNLVKNKNFDLLIESFCKAFDKRTNVKLVIAGDGTEKNRLHRVISKNSRGDQISLVGRIDGKSMLKNYKECNCFVLLSEYETFGIVYREALAIGRPVISSRNDGILECWDESYGILLPQINIENSCVALKQMYENVDKFSNIEISKSILKKYSKKIVVDEINKIILSNEKEV